MEAWTNTDQIILDAHCDVKEKLDVEYENANHAHTLGTIGIGGAAVFAAIEMASKGKLKLLAKIGKVVSFAFGTLEICTECYHIGIHSGYCDGFKDAGDYAVKCVSTSLKRE